MKQVNVADNGSVYSGSNNQNITAYKVTISILFGLLGFVLNFHTINFAFPPYTATVLIGLLFPMLITLTWGWRYGLLSALVGGCQSMWWLWGPSNGYAIFLVVPPFTLWIVWHGLLANLRRKQKEHKWWSSTYAVEIPFRIFSTINLYTLSRWAITFNPPPWSWASGAPNTIPMRFSSFVAIKQAVVGYIILLLADVLLNFGFVKRFFRLKEDYDRANTGYIISASLLIGVLFWLVDSVIGSLVFHTESSFFDLLALDVPPDEVYVRTLFILACLVGGLLASKLLRGQHESDKALRESEERFRLLVQNMPVLINAFGEGDAYLFWNRECEKVTGYSAQEIIRNPNALELLYPDASYLQQLMEEWAERGSAFMDWEMVLKSKDGSPKTISWSNISDLFPVPGWKSWAIGVDVTERKRAEESLKEYSERLEEMVEERTKELREAQEQLVRKEKLAVLGQLAGGVGHELRNPLGVISNAVYFLQLTLPDADETTATAREYLEIISEEVRNSTKIISDLLDFSRTRMPDREEIAVSELVAEVLEKRPPPENVEATTQIASDLPPVFVDPRQMGQVLVNLVVNAYQAMPEGGRLVVKTSEVSEKLPKSKWVALSITDTGCGIPEKNMAKLFEPLFTTKARGIGLGLAVSRSLVEANGGSMEVESEEGEGSTFTVKLPTREVVA